MAFVSEDKFDVYANGDLAGKNGGAGWGGAWVNAATQTQSVQGTTVYQGAKAVTISNGAGNTFYTRALASGVSGDGNILYFAIRRTLNNSGEISISARSNSGVNSRVAVRMNNAGNLTLVGTTTVTVLTGYSTSTQYAIRLTVNVTAGTATMAYNTGAYGSGTAWSAESSAVTLSSTGNIDTIGLSTDTSASTDTIDAITPHDLMTTQIDVDSVTENQFATATSLTYAHTCTGTNLLLFVVVGYADSASDLITGVTYNGVAMTRIGTRKSSTNNDRSYLYALQAPATGANNVVVSRSSSGNIESGALSFTGAQQSVTMDSTANGEATATTITETTTVVTANSFLIGALYANRAQTGGANTTVTSNALNLRGLYSTASVSTGAQSLVSTQSDSTRSCWFMASFAPAATTAIKTVGGLAYASVKTVGGLAVGSVKTIGGLA